MGADMLKVKRLSRIYYHRKFFSYPLKFFDTFAKLGAMESVKAVASLLWCKYREIGDIKTFDGWVTRNFGRELYKVFFKNYTEKVWGMPCSNLSADWAMQRLRGLSVKVLLYNALSVIRKDRPKTLAEEFLYPRTGPGEFFRRLQAAIQEMGGTFAWGKKIVAIKTDGEKAVSLIVEDCRSGKREELEADTVFSTAPLPVLVNSLIPKPEEDVLEASKKLKFRSFLVVNVVLNVDNLFPDQWIYVQEPDVKMARIQNYKNWSPEMVPATGRTSLGLEYFCNENDDFWKSSDMDLMDMAMTELEKIGIASREHLINGFVVRIPHAYPVYSMHYTEDVKKLRGYLEHFSNVRTFGRGGLFHYDNSDHALLSGLYTARNYLGNGQHDVWSINENMSYMES